MRKCFYSAVSLFILLAVLSLGVAPALSASFAAAGAPPCCDHEQEKADATPVCPTAECPHCGVLSVEIHETLTCCAVLNMVLNRFSSSTNYPPEIFPPPLEYPPQA